MSLSFQAIYDVVREIPRGTVATYGQIAFLAGDIRGARTVGWALHSNPDPEGIPCYRVVDRKGHVSSAFAFGGSNMQIQLLEADGIPCKDGFVDLKKYQWMVGDCVTSAEESSSYDLDEAGHRKESEDQQAEES